MTDTFFTNSPLGLIFSDPALGIVLILGIVLALSVHEAAHAWTADKLGDPTSKLMGRVTLNPAAHLDPLGSLLFLFTWFGWGKPVPVNDMQLKRDNDMILVALAGPASNLALAILFAILFRIVPTLELQQMFVYFISINLGLMFFNLLPIPPLDGSKVLRLFVPRETYYMLEQYGFYFVIIIFLMGGGFFTSWISGAVVRSIEFLIGA